MKANTIQFRKKCKIGSYQYDPKALVGVGYYGKVYKGVRLADKYQVAVKVVDLNLHPDKQASKFVQNELKIHQILKHQRVIHCLEIFKKNNIFYFVTQFFPEGDLEKYIKTWGPLQQEEAISLLYQVVQALLYLKKKTVIHRDIKPANIFMKEGNIKLADFGLSVLAEREIFAEELRIGTPRYMAPEILRQGIYSYKGDVWSLGSLFIEMITGQAPLSKCQSFEEITQKVLGEMIPSTTKISSESRLLLQSIFQVCQRKRISIQDLHSHSLFSGLIKKHSSISTEDNSQIHIEDIEAQSQTPSTLATTRSSMIQTSPLIKHETRKPNPRLVQLFQKFIRGFPKQNTHFCSLNYIVNNLKDRNSLKLIDLVYVEQRIEQRIKELRAEVNVDAQMEAIDLVYFKSVLEKDRANCLMK